MFLRIYRQAVLHVGVIIAALYLGVTEVFVIARVATQAQATPAVILFITPANTINERSDFSRVTSVEISCIGRNIIFTRSNILPVFALYAKGLAVVDVFVVLLHAPAESCGRVFTGGSDNKSRGSNLAVRHPGGDTAIGALDGRQSYIRSPLRNIRTGQVGGTASKASNVLSSTVSRAQLAGLVVVDDQALVVIQAFLVKLVQPDHGFLPTVLHVRQLDLIAIQIDIIVIGRGVDEGIGQPSAHRIGVPTALIGQQGDFVSLAVPIGILFLETAEHVLELIQRGGSFHVQGIQPLLVDPQLAGAFAVDALLDVGKGVNVAVTHRKGLGDTRNIFFYFLKYFTILFDIVI
ncbi:unknown [Firmicutes bacterium CAG:94]|nr:unknown [Firmicutes bacterium CAG:94]